MPKLSIVVTTYNIEQYVRQSLDCILAQTLQDIEIIVVDDGSTDDTPSIILEYAALDARIRPILFESNTIGGVASAANAGMDVATGDYIGFADGDDLYDSQMFARLYDAAVAHDADLAMCGYTLLDAGTGETTNPADVARWGKYPQDTAIDLDNTTRREILKFVSVPWRKIYRRDLVERVDLRFPVGDYFFEDNPFHWVSTLTGQRVVMIPDKLCQHRVARVGQTMAIADSRLFKIFQHHDIIKVWLIAQGLDREYAMDLLEWVANQLSWISKRTAPSFQDELFDALYTIIMSYDDRMIEAFDAQNGHGNTYKMLSALKANDRAGFIAVVAAQFRQSPIPPVVSALSMGNLQSHREHDRGNSVFSRGLYHLRNSGVRNTVQMTRQFVSERIALPQIFMREGGGKNGNAVTNEDLMAAMAVLQADVRRMQVDVRSITGNESFSNALDEKSFPEN